MWQFLVEKKSKDTCQHSHKNDRFFLTTNFPGIVCYFYKTRGVLKKTTKKPKVQKSQNTKHYQNFSQRKLYSQLWCKICPRFTSVLRQPNGRSKQSKYHHWALVARKRPAFANINAWPSVQYDAQHSSRLGGRQFTVQKMVNLNKLSTNQLLILGTLKPKSNTLRRRPNQSRFFESVGLTLLATNLSLTQAMVGAVELRATISTLMHSTVRTWIIIGVLSRFYRSVHVLCRKSQTSWPSSIA